MSPFQFGPAPTTRPGERQIVVPAGIETKNDLLNHLARAFSLPDYFGHNWDALEECLGDLSWLENKKIILVHHDIPLGKIPADARIYLQVLSSVTHKSARLSIFFPEPCRQQVTSLLEA